MWFFRGADNEICDICWCVLLTTIAGIQCVCVCALTHWCGLVLGTECWWGWCWEKERKRVLQFVPPLERQRQMSAQAAALVGILNIHTLSDSEEGLLYIREEMKVHTLFVCLSLCPIVSFIFSNLSETWGLTDWCTFNLLLAWLVETKLLIASHLPVRGQTRAAEFDWEPAVGGSSQLSQSNQIACWYCWVLKYSSFALRQLYGWSLQ